jgi:hypothetical protein
MLWSATRYLLFINKTENMCEMMPLALSYVFLLNHVAVIAIYCTRNKVTAGE